MSKRIGNVTIIAEEPEMICFQCGKIADCRPYGPNGEEICFDCAMKDEFTTHQQMFIKLFGEHHERAAELAYEFIRYRNDQRAHAEEPQPTKDSREKPQQTS